MLSKLVIITLMMCFLNSCVKCGITYYFSGYIKDQNQVAISEVNVSLYSEDGQEVASNVALSDSEGYYSFVYTLPPKSFQGYYLIYRNSNYQELKSTELSGDEAGEEKCGDIPIVRDVELAATTN